VSPSEKSSRPSRNRAWIAFLVLTIAGERLELNRLLRRSPRVSAALVAAILLVGGGAALIAHAPAPGVRVVGAGLPRDHRLARGQ
jgi:hypothetical protein